MSSLRKSQRKPLFILRQLAAISNRFLWVSFCWDGFLMDFSIGTFQHFRIKSNFCLRPRSERKKIGLHWFPFKTETRPKWPKRGTRKKNSKHGKRRKKIAGNTAGSEKKEISENFQSNFCSILDFKFWSKQEKIGWPSVDLGAVHAVAEGLRRSKILRLLFIQA